MKKSLSVITVTYNSENIIEDCLSSVTRELPDSSEIIVVDNSGSAETRQIVSKYKNARYISSVGNVGFSKGCNIGVRASEGEMLLFLNPDTKILQGALKMLLTFAVENPSFGIISPQLIVDKGDVQPSVRKFPTIMGVIKEYYLGQKNQYEAYFPIGEDTVEVDSVVGAAMLIKKDIFLTVNMWDEKYFMYYEDLELCRRIQKLGLKIYYVAKSHFYHKVGGSLSLDKSRYINESFWKYHGWLIGSIIRLLLVFRPDNFGRKLKKIFWKTSVI